MNLITYRFTLDLAKHGSQTVLSGFKVGDTNRAIDVSLSMNGEPYYLGADQAAQLRAKYIGENEVVKQTYACTIANNRIFCKIDPALLTATGELHLDLEVGDLDSEIFSTASFLIFVKGTVSNDEEIPSDDYTSVITALANSENALKNSISTAEVEENGNLVFTLHDGKMLDCGNVIGPQGPQGDKGDKGEKGDKGDKGDVDHTALAEVRRYKHDYDCNGVVDINDAVYLLYHTRNSDEYPIPSWCNADFNGDGVVNEEDAIDMQYAVNYPADYPHLYDTDARTADYSIVANALKGSASGEAVSMTDVSPLEHNIGVKLASKNVLPYPWHFTSTTTTGGLTYTDNGDGGFSIVGDISATNEIYLMRKTLPAGTYTFSITGKIPQYTSASVKLYDPELKKTVKNFGDVTYTKKSVTFTITDEEAKTRQVWINVYSYYNPPSYTYETLNLVLYPQIELGTTATSFAPCVADVSSITLKKCGKNLLDLKSYVTGANYGTTVSTTESVNGVTITQTQYPDAENHQAYRNGYVEIRLNSIPSYEEYYVFSCDVEILTNPLGATYIASLFSALGGYYSSLRSPDGLAFEVGKKYRLSGYWTFTDNGKNYIELRNAGMNLILSNLQLEKGTTASEYEPYVEPIPYTPSVDGTVDGVTSLYPSTTLLTDTAGVTITAEYNKDLNKAFEEIQQKLTALSAVLINNA